MERKGLYRAKKITDTSLSQGLLKELAHYDEHTGKFTRIKSTSPRFLGKLPCPMEALHSQGYYVAMVNGKSYPAHKLAFLYMEGQLPDKTVRVDHINGDTLDNRWCNLRLVAPGENVRNQKAIKNTESGHTGVHKRNGKFVAHIRIDKKLKHLGTFTTLEEAVSVRKAALAEHLNSVSLQKTVVQFPELKDIK